MRGSFCAMVGIIVADAIDTKKRWFCTNPWFIRDRDFLTCLHAEIPENISPDSISLRFFSLFEPKLLLDCEAERAGISSCLW